MFKIKIILAIIMPFSGIAPFLYRESQFKDIDPNIINMGVEKDIKDDPTIPGFEINPNLKANSSVSNKKTWWKDFENHDNKTYSINTIDYANNKDEFIKKYPSVEISWSANWVSSGWNINKNYSGTKSIKLSNNSQTITVASEQKEGAQNTAKFDSKIGYYWSSNKLVFEAYSFVRIHKGGNNSYTESINSITIKKIKFNSSFNFETTFKDLDKKLGKGQRDTGNGYSNQSSNNGEVVKIESDYSPNIVDNRNWKQIENILNQKILKTLNDENDEKGWIDFLRPTFSLSSDNLFVITTFKNVYNHKTKKTENWKFSSRLDFRLSDKYLTEKIFNRIEFLPGKVINDNGIDLIEDVEEVIVSGDGKEYKYNNGKIRFHSNVTMYFSEIKESTNDPDFDSVKINGKTLNSVNGFYSYYLDGLIEEFGSDPIYKIEIDHKANPNEPLDENFKYNIQIEIATKTPSLDLKLMGWGKNNIDYDRLTKPTKIENGKEINNPDYDKEISVETGTKKQIIWVKNESNYPFALDPISKSGEILEFKDFENYDYGYIAEASSGGAGFNNFWDNDNVKNVSRYSSNYKLDTKFVNAHDVIRNDESDLNTSSGFFHFVVEQKISPGWTTNGIPPKYNQKFFYVDDKKDNNYDYFLNNVDDEYASNFWTTVHGIHLKNYMINYRDWNSSTTEEFNQLSFENIMSYWNDYVSAIRNKKAVDQTPNNLKSLKDFEISDLVFNEKNSQTLIESVITSISEKMKNQGFSGVYGDDWEIQFFVEEKWEKDPKFWEKIIYSEEDLGNIESGISVVRSINVRVASSGSSLKLSDNSDTFKIWNRSDKPEQLFNLEQLPLDDQIYNFENQSKENIVENYIFDYIKLSMQLFNLGDLENGTDYKVSLYGFNGSEIDENSSKIDDFLNKSKNKESANLKITVWAVVNDDRAPVIEGIKSYNLINKPDGLISPDKPIPPSKPDENIDNLKPTFNKKNLIWIIPLVIIGVGIIGVGIFCLVNRRKKKFK